MSISKELTEKLNATMKPLLETIEAVQGEDYINYMRTALNGSLALLCVASFSRGLSHREFQFVDYLLKDSVSGFVAAIAHASGHEDDFVKDYAMLMEKTHEIVNGEG